MPVSARRPDSRAMRSAARQRARLNGAALGAGFLAVLLAFAGGFLWRSGALADRWRSAEAIAAFDEEQRSAALSLFDEAVQAQYEERWQGAANAVAALRQQGRPLPGLDALVAEIAMTRGDPETSRLAAHESLRRGESTSSAHLMLALEKWITRNQVADATLAGELALHFLQEAADFEPSNGAVYYFWGEMNRMAGSLAEAQQKLLGSLHREMPWRSSALLAIKRQLAVAEAQRTGRPAAAPLPQDLQVIALDLMNSPDDPARQTALRTELLAHAPLMLARFVLRDRGLSPSDREAAAEVEAAAPGSLPFPGALGR